MEKKSEKRTLTEWEQAGYKFVKRVPTVRKTLEIPAEYLEKFQRIAYKKNIKIKECTEEMFNDFIKKYKKLLDD